MYSVTLFGNEIAIEGENGVFSPFSPDKGTMAMLSLVQLSPEDKVLDLGCGCGIVGIAIAKAIGEERVFMLDREENAVALSKRNAAANGVGDVSIVQSDGFNEFRETGFTLILSNPPYHEDFSVPKHFIEKGFNRLVIGGKMMMVTKRLGWYKNKLISVFGGVRIAEIDGYYVFTAEKRSGEYSGNKKNKAKKSR